MANRRKSQQCPRRCGRFHRNDWGCCRTCLAMAGLEVRPDGCITGYGAVKSREIMRAFLALNEGRSVADPLLVPPLPAPSRFEGEKTSRPCLCCKGIFASAGPHNRICTNCKGGDDWRGGDMGGWNVGGFSNSARIVQRNFPVSGR